MKEHGDKITADEKKNIETGISDLKEALKGTDVEEIKKKTQSLIQVSMKLGRQFTKVSRRLRNNNDKGDKSGPDTKSKADKENVVDADFEDVKEDKEKAPAKKRSNFLWQKEIMN